jgi:hypothetical protein
MKRALQIAGLTAIMLLVSAGVARADTLQFLESDQAGSATFTLLQSSKLTLFAAGNDFLKDAQMFTESEASPIFSSETDILDSDSDSDSVTENVTATAMPEPSTLLLLGFGLVGLGLLRKR